MLKFQEKTETEIVREILDALVARRMGFFWRQNNGGIYDKEKGEYRRGSKYSIPGISDILGIYQNKFTTIEVKTPKAYASVMKFIGQLKTLPGNILDYIPKNKFEEHTFNQFKFLMNVIKNGGAGFFTFSFEHALSELGKLNSPLKTDLKREIL